MRREHKRIIKIQRGNKTKSANTMENFIKNRIEEFKEDGIICTKKEKYYLITLEQIGRKFKNLNICYKHTIICGLD